MERGVDYIGNTVSFFCHDGDGNYLFNLRSKEARDEHGRWDSGGGGIDFGEGVIETLRREIKEEYGTEVIDYEFLGYRDVHREQDGKPTHWISLDFRVLIDRGKVKNGEPRKFERLGWYRLTELPHPLHSQFETALIQYLAKLK